MKSFEARLELLESARAKRRIAKHTKLQRDQAVENYLRSINAGNRGEMLQAALRACADKLTDRAVGSREQREAAVRAVFGRFDLKTANER